MTLAIIQHPDCALHSAGPTHPEQPARYQVIADALREYPFRHPPRYYQAPLATREELALAHDPDYIAQLFALSPKNNYVALDTDTAMNAYTLQAALLAAGAARLAIDLVLGNEAKAVFCNVRPPGHHAEHAKAMGFCFFNNMAIAVKYALQHYHLPRIAIIDFDVHHGNGTQQILQQESRVLFCSSFQHPFYPGYDAHFANEHIINVPLAAGTNSHDYRAAVANAWFARLREFQPQLICFSAGFDAHRDDPLAQLTLTKADYVWLTQEIAAIADATCEGKMISLLEGGYHLPALTECVPAHVAAMEL